MRTVKRMLAAGLTAGILAGFMSFPAYAANKKVSSISLVVESEIKVGEECSVDDITITTKSDTYLIGDMEFQNDSYEWGASDIPILEVYVEANDGYYLSLQKTKKDIKLKGAEYVTGKKMDSKTVLLTLRLPPLAETTGEIESANWENSTVGTWPETYNVSVYEVRLYVDGKTVGSTKTTNVPRFDFASMMLKQGTYTYKVRAVNKVKPENKSEWIEAGSVNIDQETAVRHRETYGTLTSGFKNPGEAVLGNIKDGWNQDGTGWWYRNTDGSFTTSNWQQIEGKWYFFNSEGYMQTGWILWDHQQYYCDESGAMLVSTTTPDGQRVDSSGVCIQ